MTPFGNTGEQLQSMITYQARWTTEPFQCMAASCVPTFKVVFKQVHRYFIGEPQVAAEQHSLFQLEHGTAH